MLYEVAILEVPSPKEREDGAQEKLVFGPTAVVANDAQSAAINAVLSGDASKINKDKMSVLVRPFV